MRLWSNILAAAVDGGVAGQVWVSSTPPPDAEGAVDADGIGVWIRRGDGWALHMTVTRAIGSDLPDSLDACLRANGSAALVPAAAVIATDRSGGRYRVRIGKPS